MDPAEARARYLEQLHAHLAKLESITVERGAALHRVTTDTPLENPLREFLHSRQRAGSGGRQFRSNRPAQF